jgi:hypothetical protein
MNYLQNEINNEYEKDTSDFDVGVHDDIGFGPGVQFCAKSVEMAIF